MGVWRSDLGPRERIRLALKGLEVKGYYGAITDLAREYKVSRWFVYHLMHLLVPVWLDFSQPRGAGPKGKSTVIVVDQNRLDRGIVTLCLAGCSLEGTQVCLEELLDTRRSIGYISQVLQRAQQEAARVNGVLCYDTEGVGLLDELFCHQKPILTILEPESTALLNLSLEDHRDGTTWGVRLLEVEEQGFHFQKVGSDAAGGIHLGVEAALGADFPHQLDIGHLFGKISKVERALERKAYKAIGEEAERWRVLDSARSEAVIQKRVAAYEQAREACEQAISLYEDFHYLAGELYLLFEPVTPQGKLHSPGAIRDDLGVLLELLALVPVPEVGALASRLEAQAPGLLFFLGEWAQSYAALQTQVDDPELLSALLLEATLSCGKYSKASRPLAEYTLTTLKEKLDTQFSHKAEHFRPLVFAAVDTLIRGSSLVETANSWLSPYLLKRKGVTQGFLELFRLAHNTHTYRRGKRKGHSPFELLGVELPDQDWLVLLGFQPKEQPQSA